jgi:TrmH family RNA methyltransferase
VLDSGQGCVVEVFATPAAAEQYAGLLTGSDVTLVDDRALASLSDAKSPAGIVAVCRHLDVSLAAIVGARATSEPVVEVRGAPATSEPVVEVRGAPATSLETTWPLLAICADIRDPGNAGTVIRTADAAGAVGLVLAGDAVDAYNPKTVRASVGSLFHLPVALARDPAAAVRAAQDAGFTVLAADGAGEVDLYDADDLLRGPTAWLFGNEAWGLPEQLAGLADHRVRIPIHGRAESLNLATAAAVCLYASARALRR